jgi:hypothetical protein
VKKISDITHKQINVALFDNTVKPVLRGHIWDKGKMAA